MTHEVNQKLENAEGLRLDTLATERLYGKRLEKYLEIVEPMSGYSTQKNIRRIELLRSAGVDPQSPLTGKISFGPH